MSLSCLKSISSRVRVVYNNNASQCFKCYGKFCADGFLASLELPIDERLFSTKAEAKGISDAHFKFTDQARFSDDDFADQLKTRAKREDCGELVDPTFFESHTYPGACRAVAGLSFQLSLSRSTRYLTLQSSPTFVDTIDGLHRLENMILEDKYNVAGFDTESCRGDLCTVQIAIRHPSADSEILSFVVDALNVTSNIEYRNVFTRIMMEIFASKIVLGFAAVENDVPKLEDRLGQSLCRDRVLDIRTLWKDGRSLTMCIQRLYPEPVNVKRSPAASGKNAKWNRRPLKEESLEYAALDAAVLLVVLAEASRFHETIVGNEGASVGIEHPPTLGDIDSLTVLFLVSRSRKADASRAAFLLNFLKAQR